MDSNTIFKFATIAWCFACCFALPHTTNDAWTLRVVHTNDMHARFDETSARSTKCSSRDVIAGKCYGGFARIATLVRQAKNSTVPTIFLNAGDTYQGTIWYNVHKWKIVAAFLNLLNPDAISLGNHEFDDGPAGLVPFINASKFPIVAANLNVTGEPELAATNLKKSVVLDVAGHKIGVIGYLTPETRIISAPGNVEFLDEVKSIQEEVKILQSAGIKILIALGHSGFAVDKKIAAQVDGLDLVIGGHTNTFLYTGKKPDLEKPEGLYPTEVTQKSGRKVYVVQAYAYTKYLGNLTIDFDTEGEIKNIQGDPILVDSSIEEAKDILDELEKWRPAVNNIIKKPVGSTKVLLDGDSTHCRLAECNLGNLIVDAMIDYNVKKYDAKDGWTDAAIAIHNSGSMRASIARSPDDKITLSDVLAVLPFNNEIVKLDLSGKVILQMLEHSAYYLGTGELRGSFLHLSGIQVEYDLSRPSGSRVVSALVRCADCQVPEFKKLDYKKVYKVLMTDFIVKGGDGFSMLTELESTPIGVTTDQALVEYLLKHSPVHPGVEWRSIFVNKKSEIETIADVKRQKNSGERKFHPLLSLIISANIALFISI